MSHIYHLSYVLHPSSTSSDDYQELKTAFISMLKSKFGLYMTIATTCYISSPLDTSAVINMIKDGFCEICRDERFAGAKLEVDMCLINTAVLGDTFKKPKHLNPDGSITTWPDLDNHQRWRELYS